VLGNPQIGALGLILCLCTIIRSREASWRSGDVADCKSAHPGSIPGEASNSLFSRSLTY
jgi:hypothetical protein